MKVSSIIKDYLVSIIRCEKTTTTTNKQLGGKAFIIITNSRISQLVFFTSLATYWLLMYVGRYRYCDTYFTQCEQCLNYVIKKKVLYLLIFIIFVLNNYNIVNYLIVSIIIHSQQLTYDIQCVRIDL